MNLGSLIPSTDSPGKDAVHMAVAPVVAGTTLFPGDRVAFNSSRGVVRSDDPIGIIDPFLPPRIPIPAGQKCWLLLFPGSVTGIRHEWNHPAFPMEAVATAANSDSVSVSTRWILAYATDIAGVGYESFMDDVRGGQIYYSGRDLHSSGEVDDAEQLMHHLSVVLGRSVSLHDFEFGCSC